MFIVDLVPAIKMRERQRQRQRQRQTDRQAGRQAGRKIERESERGDLCTRMLHTAIEEHFR